MQHDFLQFEGGAVRQIDDGVRLALFDGVPLRDGGALRVGWTGPWPPPERMGVAVGKVSGIVKIFDPLDLGGVGLDELTEVAHVTVYDRESASAIPDDAEMPNVARGALYVPGWEPA